MTISHTRAGTAMRCVARPNCGRVNRFSCIVNENNLTRILREAVYKIAVKIGRLNSFKRVDIRLCGQSVRTENISL